MGWLITLWVVAIAIIAVVIGVSISNERHLADDCYSLGGIPIQGDETNGNPVVCLDPSAVLND
jgi:hypothetical protein